MRATSMPARINPVMISGELDAGPKVQTIFVFANIFFVVDIVPVVERVLLDMIEIIEIKREYSLDIIDMLFAVVQ